MSVLTVGNEGYENESKSVRKLREKNELQRLKLEAEREQLAIKHDIDNIREAQKRKMSPFYNAGRKITESVTNAQVKLIDYSLDPKGIAKDFKEVVLSLGDLTKVIDGPTFAKILDVAGLDQSTKAGLKVAYVLLSKLERNTNKHKVATEVEVKSIIEQNSTESQRKVILNSGGYKLVDAIDKIPQLSEEQKRNMKRFLNIVGHISEPPVLN